MINSRKMRWAEYVACMTENKSAYKVLIGEVEEGKRSLERSKCRRGIILKWLLKK
jgi:hypothetical protein